MSDQSASGSRWEPTAGQPAAPTTDQPAPTPVRTSRWNRVRSFRSTSTIGVAGIAVALLLLGGAGGFALGHLVSHDRPATSVPRRGFDPNGDHHRGFGSPQQGPPADLQPQDGSGESGPDDTTSGGDGT